MLLSMTGFRTISSSPPRVMAMAGAMTRTLGGSAACTREAEPLQGHDLARAKSRGNAKSRGHREHRLRMFLRVRALAYNQQIRAPHYRGNWQLPFRQPPQLDTLFQ